MHEILFCNKSSRLLLAASYGGPEGPEPWHHDDVINQPIVHRHQQENQPDFTNHLYTIPQQTTYTTLLNLFSFCWKLA